MKDKHHDHAFKCILLSIEFIRYVSLLFLRLVNKKLVIGFINLA